MKIRIKIKNPFKLKDLLTYEQYLTNAETVEEFINEIVANNVEKFNQSRNKDELLIFSEETITNISQLGKISFGGKKENKRKVDIKIMQDEAIFQFQNNRFKIINETQKKEYKILNENLNLTENDCLVFIKLAMLSGRRF